MSNLTRQCCRTIFYHIKHPAIANYPLISRGISTARAAYFQNKLFMFASATLTTRPFSGKTQTPSTQQDPVGTALLDLVTYETICSDTLEGLCEYFDELVETAPHLKNADISYSDGVLTINFGKTHGSYVINRQTPNRQIWLSSPTTGPKRYDFVKGVHPNEGYWTYKHDGVALHALLQQEIGPIVRKDVDFSKLPYGKS